MPPLLASRRLYQRQQLVVASGIRAAHRFWPVRDWRAFAAIISMLQFLAARNALDGVEEQLDELNIEAPGAGVTSPAAFMGHSAAGAPLVNRLSYAESVEELTRIILTEIEDAGREAQSVDMAQRPDVTGYVRFLNPPSCARCTILAGRWYRWSEGFQRHDNCDCFHIPLSADVNPEAHWTDPMAAFRRGDVTDLTVAQTDAINDGADISKVVNMSKQKAGLTISGLVLERGGRLTPAGIYQLASDRDEAIDLLKRYGFIR